MAHILLLLPLCLLIQSSTNAFQVHSFFRTTKCSFSISIHSKQIVVSNVCSGSTALHNSNGNDNATTRITEAEKLMAKAKAIRESIPISTNEPQSTSLNQQQTTVTKILSEFSLPQQSLDDNNNNYRLYLDIGREKGTWMDPRWGARYVLVINFICAHLMHIALDTHLILIFFCSGRRIECTIDISFATTQPSSDEDDETQLLASEDVSTALIKTVTNKSSSLSQVYKLQSAPYARLRGGFDKMTITNGGWCIERGSSSSSTLRFCMEVAGTKDGDVTIPEGKLYFALPYFGQQKATDTSPASMALSGKEGTITVKQMGWNTGWRREESRILGIFRAVPLTKAKSRDKF